MVKSSSTPVAREARVIYESLRPSLEASHVNEFVAIEPISGEHFLGETLSDAIGCARRAHPDRVSHAFRVGHPAAVHFGMQIR